MRTFNQTYEKPAITVYENREMFDACWEIYCRMWTGECAAMSCMRHALVGTPVSYERMCGFLNRHGLDIPFHLYNAQEKKRMLAERLKR